MKSVEDRFDEIKLLHPRVRAKFAALTEELSKHGFRVFETWRSPQRQATLLGRSSKADAWQSAHQYGLAADFVRYTNSWDWSGDYTIVRRIARGYGLDAPILWDPGHVQPPNWNWREPFVF